MSNCRIAGILAHPTSFPSAFGIGDLGPVAHRFVDWLAEAGQRVWQVLPLGLVDQYGSPYRSPSAFAGNDLLISPEDLAEEALISREELDSARTGNNDEAQPVDFAEVMFSKRELLEKAHRSFRRSGNASALHDEFSVFCSKHAEWLDEFATFMALSEVNETRDWTQWTRCVTPEKRKLDDVKLTESGTLQSLSDIADFHRFVQFLFFRQWYSLREHAHRRGITIFGDMPIYVSSDSADVWGNRELFELDGVGRPTRVAGVPPDYFSATGQLWLNPLYDWDAMRSDGYAWWVRRVRAAIELVDVVRLDHFRGFHAYWAVSAGAENAVKGQWVEGPGSDLLEVLQREYRDHTSAMPFLESELPIIAEDLGIITPDVIELRKQFRLSGMAVLQFGFGAASKDCYVPQNVAADAVAYTGTHDNDTTVGWYQKEVAGNPEALERLGRFISAEAETVAWKMIELTWGTRARVAIAPLQDVLSLGSQARMNTPGQISGNWRWRFQTNQLTDELGKRLGKLTRRVGRDGRVS